METSNMFWLENILIGICPSGTQPIFDSVSVCIFVSVSLFLTSTCHDEQHVNSFPLTHSLEGLPCLRVTSRGQEDWSFWNHNANIPSLILFPVFNFLLLRASKHFYTAGWKDEEESGTSRILLWLDLLPGLGWGKKAPSNDFSHENLLGWSQKVFWDVLCLSMFLHSRWTYKYMHYSGRI